MVEVKLGAATVRRIEEPYEPNFDARTFFPDWQSEVVAPHLGWHAVQVHHPEWNSFACVEPVGARLMPCHFGAPFTCHIDHKEGGFAPSFDG